MKKMNGKISSLHVLQILHGKHSVSKFYLLITMDKSDGLLVKTQTRDVAQRRSFPRSTADAGSTSSDQSLLFFGCKLA